MHDFTPLSALAGGVLIGLAAAGMWILSGRIAGVSGILASSLSRAGDRSWRVAFLAGLIGAGFVMTLVAPERFGDPIGSIPLEVAAGLLVGLGTALGNGCTSGHGVCGIGRLSPRSLVATTVFIATGALTVAALRGLGIS